MTREEAIAELKFFKGLTFINTEEAIDVAIEVLEQEPKTDYKAFAEWVATEIFDDNWEYNYGGFAEIACRKLSKLGIVTEVGNEWELVKPQESEVSSEKDSN